MEIYFLRHGDAEEAAPGQSDAERTLTKKGKKQGKRAGRWFDEHDIEFDAIVSSPLVRARKTAQRVAKVLGLQLVQDTRLGGGSLSTEELAEIIDDLGSPQTVLLVGHEPDFSYVIGQLTDGSVDMGKGTIACVECDEIATRSGTLTLLVPSSVQK